LSSGHTGEESRSGNSELHFDCLSLGVCKASVLKRMWLRTNVREDEKSGM